MKPLSASYDKSSGCVPVRDSNKRKADEKPSAFATQMCPRSIINVLDMDRMILNAPSIDPECLLADRAARLEQLAKHDVDDATLQRCVCLRQPHDSEELRVLHCKVAMLLQNAYNSLCVDGLWDCSNFEENRPPFLTPPFRKRVVCSSVQDGMGVVNAAITAVRYILGASTVDLEDTGMDLKVRVQLATMLFMAYKIKCDHATWYDGERIQMHVLTRFLTEHELTDMYHDERHEGTMCSAYRKEMFCTEAVLLRDWPVMALMESNVVGATEAHLDVLVNAGLLTNEESMMIVGSTHCHVYAAYCNSSVDLMETLGQTRTVDEMGAVLALIGTTAAKLVFDDKMDNTDAAVCALLPKKESERAHLARAAHIVVANTVAMAGKGNARGGPYAVHKERVCAMVNDTTLARVLCELTFMLSPQHYHTP